jgi:hypothetical protein
MSPNQRLDPNYPLAPSELVLLKGDRFAKKAMLGNIQLLHTDASVSVSQLGQAALAAAIAACQQAGDIRLELRQKKVTFGLRKVTTLAAVPTGDAVNWPEHSLEAQVAPIAGKLQADGDRNTVSDVIYAWLREDASVPWQQALELIMSGMAERGALEAEKQTKLKVFTTTKYHLPEGTAGLAEQHSDEPLQALLADCQREQPQIWDALLKELKSAIKARTTQDESSSMDF